MRLLRIAIPVVAAAWGLAAFVPDASEDAAHAGEAEPVAARTVRRRGAVHDLSVRLAHIRSRDGAVAVRLSVANFGRSAERDVRVSLWCDAGSAAPLWTVTRRIGRGRALTWPLDVPVPPDATRLRAVARLAEGLLDDAPDDNEDVRPLGVYAGDRMLGRNLWMPQCSGCHGAGGGALADRSAARVLAVAWEGAPGMPRFTATTLADAIDIAAYLADPDADTDLPPAPVPCPPAGEDDDPPAGPPPTYTNRIAALVAANCLRCHGVPDPPRNVRLGTYAELVARGPLANDAIRLGFMPPDGELPASEMRAFADWVAAGMPE